MRIVIVRFRFDEIHRSRFAAARSGIHQNRGLVWMVEELVRQMNAADAEVGDAHPLGELLQLKTPRHFDAEAVVAEKNIADTGNQDTLRHNRVISKQ